MLSNVLTRTTDTYLLSFTFIKAAVKPPFPVDLGDMSAAVPSREASTKPLNEESNLWDYVVLRNVKYDATTYRWFDC